jgi:hypothetical protein
MLMAQLLHKIVIKMIDPQKIKLKEEIHLLIWNWQDSNLIKISTIQEIALQVLVSNHNHHLKAQ